MSPYTDVALWAGIPIFVLIVATAIFTYWRMHHEPRTLDYPSDQAYYAAKAREATLSGGSGSSGSAPAVH